MVNGLDLANGEAKCLLGVYGWELDAAQDRTSSTEGSEPVSFEIFRGDRVAVLGPHGSGKTLLLKTVAGVLPSCSSYLAYRPYRSQRVGHSGQVRFLGKDFLSLPPLLRAQRVSYIPADLNLNFPLTVEEVVRLGGRCQQGIGQGRSFWHQSFSEDRAKVTAFMQKCLCWHLKNRFIFSLNRSERQRVLLARALVQGSQVLILDESISQMDLEHQVYFLKIFKELALSGSSILMATHDLALVSKWAEQVLFLKNGKKVFHGPLREASSQEMMKILYPDLV